LNANRSMELTIASVILLLFLFTRYYGIGVEPAVRTLAVGLFLYSCFYVLNITVLEVRLNDYSRLWNVCGTLAFVASLLIWNWALRERQPQTTFEPEMLSDDIYRTVAPEINERLKALNEHLSHFSYVERKRS
jgi:ABC-type polysaccharide/polyol phosphate export permease